MRKVEQIKKPTKKLNTKSFTSDEIKPYSLSEQVEINKDKIAGLEANMTDSELLAYIDEGDGQLQVQINTLNQVKANTSYVNDQVALKADLSYVNNQDQILQEQINDITDGLGGTPVTVEYVDQQDSQLQEQIDTINEQIVGVDKDYVDNLVAPKADTTYVDTQDQGLQSQIDSLSQAIGDAGEWTSDVGKVYVDNQDQQLQSNIDTLENKVDGNFTTLSTNIETGDNDVLNVLDDRFTRFIARNPEELPDEYTWTFDVYSDWKLYPQCMSLIISGQPTYAITSGSIENGITNINLGDDYIINIVCPNWDETDPTVAKNVTVTNKSGKTIDNLHLNVMFEKSLLL